MTVCCNSYLKPKKQNVKPSSEAEKIYAENEIYNMDIKPANEEEKDKITVQNEIYNMNIDLH